VAIGIEKLAKVLSQESKSINNQLDERKYFIRYRKDLIRPAFRLAEKLREVDCIVELELEIDRPKEQARQYALAKKIRYLIDFQKKRCVMEKINNKIIMTIALPSGRLFQSIMSILRKSGHFGLIEYV